MRNGGPGATPPGAILPVGEGSDPPGLDRWAAPPVWPFGRWGTQGVCVSPPDTAGGIPWKTKKGRGSDVCEEASSLANEVLGRAQSSPSSRSRVLSAAGRLGLPGGELNGLVPVCIQKGSTLYSYSSVVSFSSSYFYHSRMRGIVHHAM